jgi:hypothetical protein
MIPQTWEQGRGILSGRTPALSQSANLAHQVNSWELGSPAIRGVFMLLFFYHLA